MANHSGQFGRAIAKTIGFGIGFTFPEGRLVMQLERKTQKCIEIKM